MSDLASPRAALLDIDGTLIDSNDAHARAWVDALADFGYDVAFSTVRPLIGMGGDKLVPRVSDIDPESERGKQLATARTKLFRTRYVSTLRPFAKVKELLQRMQAGGLTLVVATSAQQEEYSDLIRVAGIESLLDGATTASDADHSKPDPDIVLAAIKRSGVEPREAIMLGDTPYDITAAHAAGVRVVALRSGGWGCEDLADADAIFESPADLLAHYESSPFAR